RSASMALGESRPGVARSARPGGWGHHHNFEERSDGAALRSERFVACSRDFKPFGVLTTLPSVGSVWGILEARASVTNAGKGWSE
ncbi:MAG: hypothetical protein ACM3ZE_00860, partial [Myxococcales bacterium]